MSSHHGDQAVLLTASLAACDFGVGDHRWGAMGRLTDAGPGCRPRSLQASTPRNAPRGECGADHTAHQTRRPLMQTLATKLGPRAVLALSALVTLIVTAAPRIRFT